MASSRKSRKRQTQLAFTPLPTSSPQPSGASDSVRDRIAHVRYNSNASRSYQSRKSAQSGSLEEAFARGSALFSDAPTEPPSDKGLPTPAASSQLDGVPGQSDDSGDEVTSSDDSDRKGSPSRVNKPSKYSIETRNSTAFFSQASPSKAPPPPKSPAKSRVRSQSSLFKSSPLRPEAKSPSDKSRKSTRTPQPQVIDSDDEEDEDIVSASRHQRPRKSSQAVIDISDDEANGLEAESGVSSQTVVQDEGSSSDDSLILKTPTPRKTRSSGHSTKSKDSNNPSSNGKEARRTDGRGPSTPVPRQTRSTARKVRTPQQPVRASSPIELSSGNTTEDSGKEFNPVPSTSNSRSKRKGKETQIIESDSDVPAPSSRRAKNKIRRSSSSSNDAALQSPTKKRRIGRRMTARERAELAEDLELLRSSSTSPERTTKLSEKEQRRLNLEKMKAKREKKNARSAESESASDSEASDLGPEDLAIDEVRQTLGADDDYDEDFVDDEGAELGVNLEMPLEFTRHANEGARYHFKFVVEWLVHNKINPGFPRHDAIYNMAFQKIDDEAQGYSNSKFMSSTWRPEFNRALRARPIYTELPVVSTHMGIQTHCAACNRSGHPATFKVTLSGKAYNLKTLENLKEDNDDDNSSSDSESSDGRSVDVNGQELPSEDYEFWLGAFCKRNSARAHALLHWKWHLNDWVLDWLKNKGYTSAQYVVERENWSAKKRTKFANKVVDEMAQDEVKRLWRDFKGQLSEAREQNLYF